MATMAGGGDVLMACTVGDLPWLKRGLNLGTDPRKRNKEGMTGLHLAAKHGKLDCVRYLLDHCDISVDLQVPQTGNTPLHCSILGKAGGQAMRCMKLLLDRGASRNQKNKQGFTPLHLAARLGYSGYLKSLLERGADIHTTNNDGKTAYDLACLHGHHQCARLLRALHWASNKDSSLNDRLQKETDKRHRERQMRAVHSRIKQELGDSAYRNWKERKSFAGSERPETPVECQRRQQLRSQSNRTSTCDSCSKAASLAQSALSSRTSSAKVTAEIQVSLVQAERNISSVGKPDKLYPYTNYPPPELRSHNNKNKSVAKSTSAVPSRSQSRTSKRSTSNTPAPTGVQYSYTMGHRETASGGRDSDAERDSETDPQMSEEDECEHDVDIISPVVESKPQDLDGVEDDQYLQLPSASEMRSESEEASQQQQEDWDNDKDEFELFHDVGQTNSLNALALPTILTKSGRSAAEVVQQLRFSSSFCQGPKGLRRVNSYTSGIGSRGFSSRRFQRRFSLGAIPEGKIVTSYSDEDGSTTHLLDDQFFTYSYMATREEKTVEEDENTDDVDDLGELVFSDPSDDDAFDEEEDAQVENQPRSWYDNCSKQLSKSDPTLLAHRQKARPDRLSFQGVPNSDKASASLSNFLKVINIEWYPESATGGSKDSSHGTPQTSPYDSSKGRFPSSSTKRSSPKVSVVSLSPPSTVLHRPSRSPSPRPSTVSFSPSPTGASSFPMSSPHPTHATTASLQSPARSLSRSPVKQSPSPPTSRPLSSGQSPRNISTAFHSPSQAYPSDATLQQGSSPCGQTSLKPLVRHSPPEPSLWPSSPSSSGRYSPYSLTKAASPHQSNPSAPELQSAGLTPSPSAALPANSLYTQSLNALKSTSSFTNFPLETGTRENKEATQRRRINSAPNVGTTQRPTRVLKTAIFQFGGTLAYSH